MFRNRELRIRLAKIEERANIDNPTPKPYQDPELMNEIAKDFVTSTAKVVVVVLATSFILNAAEKLIEKALNAD